MRKSSDIPFAHDSASLFIGWMSLLMVFIATLILAFAQVTHTSAQKWYQTISGSLTVQIPVYDIAGQPRGEDSVQGDLETTLTILRSTEGVIAASVLDDAQMDQLMAPWMGEQVVTSELPLPKLIDVLIDTRNQPDFEQIRADLAEQVPLAVLDSHRVALADLLALTKHVVRLISGVFLLILASMAFTIMFVTKSGLKVHQEVIDLIHLMGAGDFYITRQFAWRSFKLTFLGSVAGVVLALPVMYSFADYMNLPDGRFILDPTLTVSQWGVLLSMPLFCAVLAYFTAFRTVWSSLRKSL